MFISLTMGFSGLFMILELFRVNKYISRFLAITPLLFLLFMVGFNRVNRDFINYQTAFTNDSFRNSFEFGYAFLVKILEYLGKDHTAIVLLAGVLFIITLLRMLKTSSYINLVIFFYCAFPLIYDINQTRNFIMYLIIMSSFVFVVKHKPIKHYAMVFIAFSIHSFALMYVPFYYLCKINRKKFMATLIRLTVICAVCSPLVITILTRLFPAKMYYYGAHPPKLGVIVFFVYALIDIFTVWWVDKKISAKLSEEDNKKMEVLYRFVWIPILILPFSFYFIEVARMQRNALLTKYIYCALAMKYLTFKERILTILLLLISASIYFVMVIYNHNLGLFNFLDENSIKYYLDEYLFY